MLIEKVKQNEVDLFCSCMVLISSACVSPASFVDEAVLHRKRERERERECVSY